MESINAGEKSYLIIQDRNVRGRLREKDDGFVGG